MFKSDQEILPVRINDTYLPALQLGFTACLEQVPSGRHVPV